MKKKTFALVLILLSLFALTACVPNQVQNGDWGYLLPNNYSISHINAECIICGKLKSEFSEKTVIDSFVTAFCHDTRFVGIMRVEARGVSAETAEYYFIDTSNDIIWGPLSEEAFLRKQAEFGVDISSDWISTSSAPEGATYGPYSLQSGDGTMIE